MTILSIMTVSVYSISVIIQYIVYSTSVYIIFLVIVYFFIFVYRYSHRWIFFLKNKLQIKFKRDYDIEYSIRSSVTQKLSHVTRNIHMTSFVQCIVQIHYPRVWRYISESFCIHYHIYITRHLQIIAIKINLLNLILKYTIKKIILKRYNEKNS